MQDQKLFMQKLRIVTPDLIKITKIRMRVTTAQMKTEQMKITKDHLRGTTDPLQKKTMAVQTNPGITTVFLLLHQAHYGQQEYRAEETVVLYLGLVTLTLLAEMILLTTEVTVTQLLARGII